MNFFQHPFSGEADKGSMAALCRAFPDQNLHVTDLPYRLSSWALDDPQNACLWKDSAGNLQAWAVLQSPFWAIDFACHPAAEADLLQEVLTWADSRARAVNGTPFGHEAWFVNVFADQISRIQTLEAAGFANQANVGEDAWSKVWMQRPVDLPVKPYPLREGFTIRPLAGESEAAAYVELHQQAFGTKNMTLEWRLRTLRHPDYTPELDLVAIAPDGGLAAFCICWLSRDAGSPPTGQVEPLGAHKKFLVYALGRAILAEGLRRLQALGAEKIHVETDNYRNAALKTYESVGFKTVRDVLVFRKDMQT